MQIKSARGERSHGTRRLAAAVVLGWLLCMTAAFWNPDTALAQVTQRSVQGRVIDSNDKPIHSAIVYLSNVRTMTVQSYITQRDGVYRFAQLSSNDDYKLWAVAGGKKSKLKMLSSFDNRPVFRVVLKIDTEK